MSRRAIERHEPPTRKSRGAGAGTALCSAFTPLADRLVAPRRVGDVGELQRPERRGGAGEDLAAREVGELHRRPAHVADEPVRPRPAEQHALGRQPRLLRAARHVELQPGLALDLIAERRPVRRLAHRGGGHRDHPGKLHPAGQRREAVQRRQRLDPALGAEPPGLAQPGAEAAEHLLVVEIGRAPRHAVEDDEAHRVRPHVDHADALQPCLGRVVDAEPGHVTDASGSALVPRPAGFRRGGRCRIATGSRQPCVDGRQSWPCTSWMTSRAPARPRPESEGFSMKKRWQEKRCSPGRSVVPAVAAVRLRHPALRLVGHVGGHDLVDDLRVHRGVGDLHQRLDPAGQVALHPVGGADVDPRARARAGRGRCRSRRCGCARGSGR